MFSESMKDGRTPAMFIGRERELTVLNTLYESDRFEFAVIYGRRRVGKTALISRFIEDKNAIYFMGVESNARQNLENFSRSILSYHTGMDTETSFMSFQAALSMCSDCPKRNVLSLPSMNTLMSPARRKALLPPSSF